jgi:membrane protein
MIKVLKKLKIPGKTLIQRLFFMVELYMDNGLANHAAAGAYAFLLSIAPILILSIYLILGMFKPSPQTIGLLISNISFLESIFDKRWFDNEFLGSLKPGISGIISVLSIFGASRIFTLSIHRGLKTIFPGSNSRNPIIDMLVTFTVQVGVLVFVVMVIFGSKTAMDFYRVMDVFASNQILMLITSKIGTNLFPLIILGLVTYLIYSFVPENAPQKLSALWGTIFFIVTYGCTTLVLGLFLNAAKYNFLYGALGNLILLLVNVYFFFILFFMGAQLAYVLDSFEAILFTKLRETINTPSRNFIFKYLDSITKSFFSVEGKLKKYYHNYKKGDIVFTQGEAWTNVFYLLKGDVEVYISSPQENMLTDVLHPGSFFGEMGYLLSEGRTATVKARTDISTLALPPDIFDNLLKNDTSIDRSILTDMSRRLKNSNDQIAELKAAKM